MDFREIWEQPLLEVIILFILLRFQTYLPSFSQSLDRLDYGSRIPSPNFSSKLYSPISGHLGGKTINSWSIPKTISQREFEEKKEHICPVNLKKFQKICVSVMLNICKGEPNFIRFQRRTISIDFVSSTFLIRKSFWRYGILKYLNFRNSIFTIQESPFNQERQL